MLHGYDIKITDEDLNDSDKEDSVINNDWTEEAYQFISEVFYGIEKQIYKQALSNPDIMKKIKETQGMLIGSRLIEFYLNQVYRGVVEKDDATMLEKFTKLGKMTDEKPIFILNLVSNIITKVYTMAPRSKLVPDSEESYLKSVQANNELMKKYILTELTNFLADLKKAKKQKGIKD